MLHGESYTKALRRTEDNTIPRDIAKVYLF